MDIQFLAADEARDLVVPDVYYGPDYGVTAALIDGGTWECAVGQGGRFVQPYLRRSILGAELHEYDIVSPYGYASPVAIENPPELAGLEQFRKDFLARSRERGLVAEFLRTNPFDTDRDAIARMAVDGSRSHTTFAISRGREPDDYFDRVEGRHRTAVRKAKKCGIEVIRLLTSSVLDPDSGFRSVYATTMDRVGAQARLRLPDEYYKLMSVGLGDSASVLEAHLDGTVCAAAIFLAKGPRLHYHLSGSTPDGLKMGATNLLIDHAVRELLIGPGRLHLGGGVRAGDGLEKFKRSIATEKLAVFLCRTVVNEQRYADLVTQSGADKATQFFPAYRAATI